MALRLVSRLPVSQHPPTIGAWIRSERKRLGLTQRELAQRIGVCVDSVTGWEGGNGLQWSQVLSLAQTFGSIPPELLEVGR